MSYPIVTYRGTRNDGTTLFVHTCTGPDKPVYVSVVKNNVWKESKAYYYEEDAMKAVNKAWPDVVWNKINPIDFVKFVIHETIIHEDDYVATVVENFFADKFDLEECEETLQFQIDGKWYEIEFGDEHMDEQMAAMYNMPEKYGYWQFYDSEGKELVEFRWEH